MKKILFVFIVIISLLVFCGCENKNKNVTIVKTPEEFISAIYRYNNNDGIISATHIALANDLDFSGYTWPIGLEAAKIDGRGHTIKNITIEVSEGKRVAMFDRIQNLVDINIENLNITYYGKDGIVGGVSAYHSRYSESPKMFDNVKISGSIYAPSAVCVGGLIGCAYSDLHRDKEDYPFYVQNTEIDIKITGGSCVGGAIGSIIGGLYLIKENNRASCGYEYIFFDNVTNKGDITAKGSFVGGLVGAYYDKAGTINNCKNLGTIKGDTYVGGLVGDALLTNCINSQNNGEIIVTASSEIEEVYAGGIAGRLGATEKISGCKNTSDINCEKNYVGGIVGCAVENTKFVECINSGKISANDFVGGIAGVALNDSQFILCENNGEIIGSGSISQAVGGIIGKGINPFVNMCSNYATINASKCAGGILGKYMMTITNNDGAVIGCTNTGKIIASSDKSYCGGIIGLMNDFDMIGLDTNANLGDLVGKYTNDIASIIEE